MLYIALALLFLAFIFFFQSDRQQKSAGLPGGRVVYTDTHGWGKVEKPLFYAALGSDRENGLFDRKKTACSSPWKVKIGKKRRDGIL